MATASATPSTSTACSGVDSNDLLDLRDPECGDQESTQAEYSSGSDAAATAREPNQGFVGGRLFVGIPPEQFKQLLGFGLQGWRGRCEFAGVLLSLLREQNRPAHQPGSLFSSETSVAMPSRIDSRMPGIETRWRVSWMARQTSSAKSTALPRLPVISSA